MGLKDFQPISFKKTGLLWGLMYAILLGDVFNFQESLDAVINTLITLIPRVVNAQRLGEFRPISLCNVIYKIVTKTLSNRLKLILPDIIFPQQSAFVPGHLITDNILIAYEVLHSMSTKVKGKEKFMALKLNMNKAYDRIEWTFPQAVMLKMGFRSKWVRWIMACVTTIPYSLICCCMLIVLDLFQVLLWRRVL